MFAISHGVEWVNEISTARDLLNGFVDEFMLRLPTHPPFPEQAQILQRLQGGDRRTVEQLVCDLSQGPAHSQGLSDLILPCLRAGARRLQVGLATTYVEQGRLTTQDSRLVLAKDPGLVMQPR